MQFLKFEGEMQILKFRGNAVLKFVGSILCYFQRYKIMVGWVSRIAQMRS
jgi:hypothetical protein